MKYIFEPVYIRLMFPTDVNLRLKLSNVLNLLKIYVGKNWNQTSWIEYVSSGKMTKGQKYFSSFLLNLE